MKRLILVVAVILALFAAQNAIAADRHLKVDGKGGWASLDKQDTIVPDNQGGWYINGRHFVPDGHDGWRTTDGDISIKLDENGGWYLNNDHFVSDGKGGWATKDGKNVRPDGDGGWITNY